MNTVSFLTIGVMLAIIIPYTAFWIKEGKKKKLNEMKKKESMKDSES